MSDRNPRQTTQKEPVELEAESPKQVYRIMKESDGALILDAHAFFEGRRAFYRVDAGSIQVATVSDSPTEKGYEVNTDTVTKDAFFDLLKKAPYFKVWPVSDSPFTAVEPEEDDAVFNP